VAAGLALAVTIGLVWRLGRARHGLGRRGLAAILGAAVVIVGLLAYTHALRTYGSPVIVQRVDESVDWMTDTLQGVPRPAEALIGFPALVWGIGTRGARRQGWWLCAFGVLGTATLAASLAATRLDPELAALSAVYSAAIGLVLGLLALGIDQMVSRRRRRLGTSGRRALRHDQLPMQPEPGRTRPLD
jgi:cytochrome c biogenesis protein CcdA